MASSKYIYGSIECATDLHSDMAPPRSPEEIERAYKRLMTAYNYEALGAQLCYALCNQFPDTFTKVEMPFHKWELVFHEGRYHLTTRCDSMRMEPTVRYGKRTKFYN